MKHLVRNTCILLALIFGAMACDGLKEQPSEPITLEEATAYGKEWEARIVAEGIYAFSGEFDFDRMIDRILDDMGFSINNDAIRKALRDALPSELNEVFQGVLDAGGLSFRKAIVEDGEVRVLFSLVSEEQLNYYEFLLHKKEGDINMQDLYIYITGEYLSRTFADIYKSTLRKNGLMKVADDHKTKAVERLAEIFDLADVQGYEVAMEEMEALKPELKNLKAYWLNMITLSEESGDLELYGRTIDEFRVYFPDDPSLALRMLNYSQVKEDHQLMRETAANLIRRVGKDKDLLGYIAYSYELEEDNAAGLKFMNSTLEDFPDDETLLNYHMGFAVAEKEYAQALTSMETLCKLYEYTPDNTYWKLIMPELFASKEYNDWLSKQDLQNE